jgi:hypothetical protein
LQEHPNKFFEIYSVHELNYIGTVKHAYNNNKNSNNTYNNMNASTPPLTTTTRTATPTRTKRRFNDEKREEKYLQMQQ